MSATNAPDRPLLACWEDGQQRLVVADVAAQDERLMLAVHQPPELRRRPVPLPGAPGTGAGVAASQEDLLEHFVDSEPEEGTLLVPVVGAPGSGKSHLIRWLRSALPQEERLVVRHVPRERTSLPRVVELLFEGLEGPAFDEMHAQLADARGSTGQLSRSERLEHIATKLVYTIAERLEFGHELRWQQAAAVDPERRTALCRATMLPAMLTDPVVRGRLTRRDGAVYRLAHDIAEGFASPPSEEREPLTFTVEDLEFRSTLGMSAPAVRAVRRLRMADWADAAARILSDAVETAAASVVGLGGVSLAELLAQARRELRRQDRELVLLFEDIAIMRGLQGDLVDALITPADRDGEAPLCTLRVAFAVTNDYLRDQTPETLSTRAHAWGAQLFDLDVPREEAMERAPDLIGRYLNAARHGIEQLRERDPEHLAQGVENACDRCPRRDACHAVFGTSAAGHGLFPLTPFAARRLAVLVADRRARPRFVLSDVVAPLLGEGAALRDGAFPSAPEIRSAVEEGLGNNTMRLSWPQLEALERAELPVGERRRAEALLSTWLERPSPELLTAFGLPAELGEASVDDAGHARPETDRPATDRPARGSEQPAPVPSRDQRDLDEIRKWASGRSMLDTTLSRRLRAAIYDELRAGVRWHEIARRENVALDVLGRTGPTQQHPNRMIDIEGASGRTGVLDEPLVRLTPGTPNANLLIAFLQRKQHGGYGFRGGAEAFARIRALVEQVEADLAERLRTRLAGRAAVADRAKLMTLAAAPLARELALDGVPAFDGALQPPRAAEGLAVEGGVAWRRLRELAQAEHRASVEFLTATITRSQGPGGPTAIEATAIDRAALARDPAGLGGGLRDGELAERHAALRQLAEEALAEEAAELAQLVGAIEAHVGADESLPLRTVRDEVDAALAAAAEAQLLSGPRDELDARAARLGRVSSTAVSRAFELARVAVRQAQGGLSLDALARVARVDRGLLESVRDYLDAAAAVLEASTAQARAAVARRGGDAIGAQTTAVHDAVERLLTSEALR